MSEAAKILEKVRPYLNGLVVDVACGDQKIIPEAYGVDGRALPGVDAVVDMSDTQNLYQKLRDKNGKFLSTVDVIFSSHFLEHCDDQYGAIQSWSLLLKKGGYLILYLPDGRYYNNHENPEHMVDMNYDNFMFWFRRAWCGEGKNYKGENLTKFFEVIDSGLDVGENRYSFFLIAKHV